MRPETVDLQWYPSASCHQWPTITTTTFKRPQHTTRRLFHLSTTLVPQFIVHTPCVGCVVCMESGGVGQNRVPEAGGIVVMLMWPRWPRRATYTPGGNGPRTTSVASVASVAAVVECGVLVSLPTTPSGSSPWPCALRRTPPSAGIVKQLLRGGAGTGTGTGWKECGVDLELVVARW